MRSGARSHGGGAHVSVAPTRASPVIVAGTSAATGARTGAAAVRKERYAAGSVKTVGSSSPPQRRPQETIPASVEPATSGPPLSPVHAERNGERASGSVAQTIVAGRSAER